MKEISIITQFAVFDLLSDLPSEIQDLMEQAVIVRKNAYAPYSKFKVGAAILLDNGQIVLGSNQENAAFPSGLCASKTSPCALTNAAAETSTIGRPDGLVGFGRWRCVCQDVFDWRHA